MILDKGRRKRRGASAIPLALVAAILAIAAGCSSGSAPNAALSTPTASKPVVVCTISTLCSLVASVGEPAIEVEGLVPLGASPETYEPAPSDIIAVSHAALIVENGEGLETWLDKLLDAAENSRVDRLVLADGVPAAQRESGNPHLWMDPAYAQVYVDEIARALAATDPAHATAYHAHAAAEVRRLRALDGWIRQRVDTIPSNRRVMICFHDAWYYFDRRYGIKNVGAIELSPGQEPSAGYFASLIALARSNHVRVIFAEPQFSPKLADSLAADAGISTVENLYDDTLGSTAQLSDYEHMMRYDVDVIVKALNS
jgi:manganese/iron transport system substrate-binding protein